jgi:hypothetical protein
MRVILGASDVGYIAIIKSTCALFSHRGQRVDIHHRSEANTLRLRNILIQPNTLGEFKGRRFIRGSNRGRIGVERPGVGCWRYVGIDRIGVGDWLCMVNQDTYSIKCEGLTTPH